jgi:hypothetical protein
MAAHECRGCYARYDVDAWRSLPFVETLGPDQLRDLFTDWPWSRDAKLEVRRCTCGLTLAWLAARPAKATEPSIAL